MKIYWEDLVMACCSVLNRHVAGNRRTGDGAQGHSLCNNASAAKT
jgi:hypothetical protein